MVGSGVLSVCRVLYVAAVADARVCRAMREGSRGR